MRITMILALTLLSSASALAQQAHRRPERPVDHGPFTPQANRAYMDGGVVLEGAPGGPAPPPSAVSNQPPPASPPRH